MSTRGLPGQEDRQVPGLWEEEVMVNVCSTEGKRGGAWTEEGRCDNEEQEEEEEAVAWTATCAHGHLSGSDPRRHPRPAPRSSWAQPSAVRLSWPSPITKQGPLGQRHDKRGQTQKVPRSWCHIVMSSHSLPPPHDVS